MTNKQTAQRALNLEPTARPCAGVIAGGEWFFTHAQTAFGQVKNDAQKMAQVFIKAHDTLKPDLIWTGGGLLNYPAHCLGAPIVDDTSASPTLTGPAIASLDDLGSLDQKAALADPINRTIDQAVKLVGAAIGEKALLFHTVWGPFTTAARVMGAEAMMMATVTNPQGLTKLIELCNEYLWGICQSLLKHEGVMGINLSEPVSSCDMISPVTFRQFVAPALAEFVNNCKAMDRYCTIHICGNSLPLFDDILQLAPHGFSMENKVDLGEAKKKLAGKICALGNIAPTGALLSGTAQQVREESLNCLAIWGDEPGYILTTGCDFPKEVPQENLMAMLEVRNG